MASHQESNVQHRIPSQDYPFQPPFLDHALSRAVEHVDSPSEPSVTLPATGHTFGANARSVEPVLDGAELLGVLREPIEWLLALAQRLADADPVDTTAVERLRTAFHARLAGRAACVRKTDVLVVFGLLVGALDPSVVVRAVSNTIGDGLAAVLEAETPLAGHLTGAVDPIADLFAALRPSRAGGRRRCGSVRSQFVR
jgi:hypothetical protein